MKRLFFSALAVAFLLRAAANAPMVRSEHLNYTVNWPSGLSLGETHLQAGGTPERSSFSFDVEAAVPGFIVSDKYSASAAGDFCSADFQKNTRHGSKKIEEKSTFDASTGAITRETSGGGKTDLKASTPCAKDALTYLYFVRHELAQGRLPQPATIYFGAPYQIRVEFAGTETIRLNDAPVQADHLTASVKGQTADIHFDVYFLKDAARTPALVKVPFSLGLFSMELVK